MSENTIEEYRTEVEARGYLSHNQHRNKAGKQKRWAYIMANRPKHWKRREDKSQYAEAVIRVEEKVRKEMDVMRATQQDFIERQILHDAPKYESKTFLDSVSRRKKKSMFEMGEEE